MYIRRANFILGAVLSLHLVPAIAFADNRWRCDDHWDRGNHYGRPSYSSTPGKWGSSSWNNSYRHPGDYDNYNRYPSSYGVHGASDEIVRKGIWSGQLTDREVRDIREDQLKLQKEQQAYWADGRLTKSERDDLRGDTNEFYNQLNHNLHDGEHRSYRW